MKFLFSIVNSANVHMGVYGETAINGVVFQPLTLLHTGTYVTDMSSPKNVLYMKSIGQILMSLGVMNNKIYNKKLTVTTISQLEQLLILFIWRQRIKIWVSQIYQKTCVAWTLYFNYHHNMYLSCLYHNLLVMLRVRNNVIFIIIATII